MVTELKASCNKLRQQNADLLEEAEAASSQLKSNLRKMNDEVEEKNEIISELKGILEQSKETIDKLRQENLDLVQEARSAKALRDEIDFLNEKVCKLDRLESEIQRYKDRMMDMEFLKSRMDELREENRLLMESKTVLQEQLDSARRRCEKVPQLEHEVVQLKALSLEVKSQQETDKEKTASLMDEVNQLRVEKKAALEELHQTRTELDHMREQVKLLNSTHSTGAPSLLDQLKSDASTRRLKLELENQKLLALVETARPLAVPTRVNHHAMNGHVNASSHHMNGSSHVNGSSVTPSQHAHLHGHYHYHYHHMHSVTVPNHSLDSSMNSDHSSYVTDVTDVTVVEESEGLRNKSCSILKTPERIASHRHSIRRIGSKSPAVPRRSSPKAISPTPSTVGTSSVWYEYGCV